MNNKMRQKKASSILILLMFAIFLTGCNKDDDGIELEENKPYKLAEIMWTLKEGDGQEIIEEEQPEQVFRNEGDAMMPVTVEPLKELQGTSHFYLDDSEAFPDLEENQITVSVPSLIELLGDSYSYIVGGQKVPFQLDKFYFPLSASTKDSLTLHPDSELSYKTTISFKKITATFKARFEQEESFDSYELEGKWEGFYFHSIDIYMVYREID